SAGHLPPAPALPVPLLDLLNGLPPGQCHHLAADLTVAALLPVPVPKVLEVIGLQVDDPVAQVVVGDVLPGLPALVPPADGAQLIAVSALPLPGQLPGHALVHPNLAGGQDVVPLDRL